MARQLVKEKIGWYQHCMDHPPTFAVDDFPTIYSIKPKKGRYCSCGNICEVRRIIMTIETERDYGKKSKQ